MASRSASCNLLGKNPCASAPRPKSPDNPQPAAAAPRGTTGAYQRAETETGSKRACQNQHRRERDQKPKRLMLYTIALILIIAWLLGLVSSYTIGGFIHILLVVAIIMILVRLIQGRKI
jgi:hypothetical protein